MNKAEKIKAEIERLKKSLPWGSCASQISMECNCKNEAYNEVLSYINSLEEDPVSNDLEEAAKNYEEDAIFYAARRISDFFKAGAQWQKGQDQSTIELAEDHAYLAGQGKIIEKACEWLKENKDHPFIKCEDPCLSGYLTDEFIDNFKKAMEE